MQRMKCSWKEGMTFSASDGLGHELLMDLGKEAGGNNSGFRPMPLLLAGLGGCMGVDVKIILDKMKVSFTGLELEIEADMDETTLPRIYGEIRVIFRFEGENLEIDKIKRAIDLAQKKYCNVSAILGKTCSLVYKAEIL